MDVWVFNAARSGSKPVLIEVFAFEPSKKDKRRAVRDHIERKIPLTDYEHGETVLRDEDIERALYYWPESHWQVQRKSLRGPDTYTTPDGYTFQRTPEGKYTDGDLTYDDFVSLKATPLENLNIY